MLHAGIGPNYMNSLLTSSNLPAVAKNTLKARERKIGPVIGKVVKESCETALQLEKTKWISTEASDGSEIIGIGASYDTGWQSVEKDTTALLVTLPFSSKAGNRL